MPTIHIDKIPYAVKAGRNLLEACLGLGFDLPYFCWHPALGSVGACRQCAVKVFKDGQDTRGKLVMSCMEIVKEGMLVSIADEEAAAFRSQIIEWLMTNHPHDCPVCDEGGNCHLQDMTVMTGHNYRRFQYKKRTFLNQYLGPLIHHEMNRCIQCYRCVRFYRDYAGGNDLNVFSAHDHVYFGREKEGVLQSPFSGNLAEICPTGVFTDKTLKEHYTRKWDLTTAPSVCQHCSLGCNTTAGERYGTIRNITNRFNGEVNGYFLCDRGRYGYAFVNSVNRVVQPLLRHRAVESVDDVTLMEALTMRMAHQKLIGIGSPRASVESNFALMQLVGKENFYQGVTEELAYLEKRIVDVLGSGALHCSSLGEIAGSDAVLVVGEDVWNTAPVMALAIRQAVMKKGFLANTTVAPSPLDEISACTLHAAPDDIARLGFAIAHLLDPSVPPVPTASEEIQRTATSIAEALRTARRPVIISGASCYNEALIRAAYAIATALDPTERKVGIAYVLPECNSMGLAMMRAPSIDAAIERTAFEHDLTVLVLENDLYRILPAKKADDFFRRFKNIIVLDSLNNLTTEKATVLLPAATFADGDGTLVNNEGRAQRFYQVFIPANQHIKESWWWLWKLHTALTAASNGHECHPDEVLARLETALPQFAGISRAAPPPDFRIHGEMIPREPHRYSGRTAMLANLSVSEPKPRQDSDSPMTFTMEGYQRIPPSPLIPFFWAPGWNSVQSVNKYQQEPGGALKGGDPGIRLFEQKAGADRVLFTDPPDAFAVRDQKWMLLPQHHVFGSEELSGTAGAIGELTPAPVVALSPRDARQLGVVEGTIIRLRMDQEEVSLPVKIQEGLCNGVALAPAGWPGMAASNWGTWVNISA
ncbi:NADH-quinone oxidoreductase subunit NuoG [Flavitalea sp. BT771]|uniref:NADH-quinone oxidoreductase subunit NuoG n=1 Tax=Flavitalea sp. BT771 TaxID=3063329 RepID=UPI0026E1194D|nr:NADH-quinone oxidoreductase subunit NuoG [Flavitalea sp. BT771]MDO6429067.1 NADH-quinone oxidoreductase subunit NuoG [Flavitalea sp. BT771]MDV6218805.1 NADH-quinone oxidoreductase subunit NuoG [Flavitalea sp. BT771]